MKTPIADRQALSLSPALDLASWREFQEGLSYLLDVPISLYARNGTLISSSRGQNPLCAAMKSTPTGAVLCHETCRRAITQAIDKENVYIYKCPVNQYLFAVPAILDRENAYVILGGHAYLSGDEFKEFDAGTSVIGFEDLAIERLKNNLRTINPASIFKIPTVIKSMAIPFLRSGFQAARGAVAADPNGGKQEFRRVLAALQGVYRSIAPVLDREELYETILAKSSELVEAEKGTLMILDSKNNLLSVKASKGLDRSIVDTASIKLGEGISGAIAAKGVPVMVRDIEAEVPSRKNRPHYRTRSFISIPLKLENRVIGVINVSDKLTGKVFSEDDLHLLMSFASYASIALERGAYYSMSEELKMLSMTDPLTGLFNRRYFRERLFEEVERVKRHSECFTAFMIDIDNFKSYNDRYGHIAGDEVLKSTAKAIRDAVRSMDVVARYGGEEFSVILPRTDKKDSLVIAERIRKNVEGFVARPEHIKEWPTISLGAAEFPCDASNIDDLINKADRAMYMAKRAGKNRVVIYEG